MITKAHIKSKVKKKIFKIYKKKKLYLVRGWAISNGSATVTAFSGWAQTTSSPAFSGALHCYCCWWFLLGSLPSQLCRFLVLLIRFNGTEPRWTIWGPNSIYIHAAQKYSPAHLYVLGSRIEAPKNEKV